MDYQTRCFFEFIFDAFMLTASLAAIVAFFWWSLDGLIDTTKALFASMSEKQQTKALCFDNGYTELKWANGEYYCVNEATGDIVSVERLKE